MPPELCGTFADGDVAVPKLLAGFHDAAFLFCCDRVCNLPHSTASLQGFFPIPPVRCPVLTSAWYLLTL